MEYRPCSVNGKNALFHRWIEVDRIVLRFKTNLPEDSRNRAIMEYHKTNIVPNCMERDKSRKLMALVEFEDGTVDEVLPSDIQFLDSEKYFQKENG